jgi:metal-sulfur cluster biosynthetic enzyme
MAVMSDQSEDLRTGSRPAAHPAPVHASEDGVAVDTVPAVAADTVPEDEGSVKEQVLEALHRVNDPELGINIVDLGLVYGVELQDETVHITYTLTTMGCPIGPLIEAEIKQLLSGIDGVSDVDAEMVLRPPWTPEMMSDEAKAALGFF